MMFEHGKHVLIEKPLCLNEKQTKQRVDCAESKKLFLMAIWSRFFPSYECVQKQIQNGALGEVVSVEVGFGFGGFPNMDELTLV